MNLGELLDGAGIAFDPPAGADPAAIAAARARPVAGLTTDSRECGPGSIFVAVRGTSGVDGHAHAAAALAAGAVAVIADRDGVLPAAAASRAWTCAAGTRAAASHLAAAFHGHPSRSLRMVGVTGTSGKTTTSYLLEAILAEDDGTPSGLIGTVETRVGSRSRESTHTTPGPIELQAALAWMRSAGARSVAMEVSSHALDQRRADAVAFDAVAFTNLSPEHLDYHPGLEEYFAAKARLFGDLAEGARRAGKRPAGAIPAAGEWGARLRAAAAPGMHLITWGWRADAEISGAGWRVSLAGIEGTIGAHPFRSPLPAAFNGENILAAAAAARGAGVGDAAIARGIERVRAVPGRLEAVARPAGPRPGDPVVLVDYAHKPDALDKVLRAVRAAGVRGGLGVVIGCGGDRDRGKRPVMGRIAAELADWVHLTSDNPRTEDPGRILDEIAAGVPEDRRDRVRRIEDRGAAIDAAIARAGDGDVVVIAGKGHENYQITGSTKRPFDDRARARDALDQVIKRRV